MMPRRPFLIFSLLARLDCRHSALAKESVKLAFIGPLTGGVSTNGLGGRNSADLAVKLRTAEGGCTPTNRGNVGEPDGYRFNHRLRAHSPSCPANVPFEYHNP